MKLYQPAHYVVDEFTTESELFEQCDNTNNINELLLINDKIVAILDVDIAIDRMMRS